MKIVSKEMLDKLSRMAEDSPRLRKNHNFHEGFADPVNRMLNAFEPGTYVQPHKHQKPDKREVFIVLRGSLVVVFFDDLGNPIDFVYLNPNRGNYAVEIAPGIWHTVFSLEKGSVVYEIKDGPYSSENDKNFAAWAPKEGEQDCELYLENLTKQYNDR